MGTILTLAAKDLRRRAAAPGPVLLNLAIPLAIAGMLALAFGGGTGGGADPPPLKLVLVMLDEGPLSEFLSGASQNSQTAGRLEVLRAKDRQEGLARLREEEAAAMALFPEGFTRDLIEGRQAVFELVKNPSQSFMPLVAEQGAEVLSLYLTVGRRLLGDDAARLQGMLEGEGWSDTAGLALALASLYGRIQSADGMLFPPLIETGEPAGDPGEARGGFDFMSWMYPGMLMMGLLFVGAGQMRDLLMERQAGTLRRQLCAPVAAWQVVASKVLSAALVVGAAHVLLMGAGSAFFGVRWGSALPLALVSALIVAAVTGFCALLFALVRTERQGDAVSGIVIMVMSLMGGTFIPPQALPEAMRGMAYVTMNHWGHDALRELASGKGWAAVAAHAAALAAMAAAFILAGTLLLRRRHVRGAL